MAHSVLCKQNSMAQIKFKGRKVIKKLPIAQTVNDIHLVPSQ